MNDRPKMTMCIVSSMMVAELIIGHIILCKKRCCSNDLDSCHYSDN